MPTILCVDDSSMIRNLMTQILTKEGHVVLTADDGNSAMELSRKQAVDLVLSDVNMPGMNGISLVAKLRLLEGYQNTPIIMVTTERDEYKKGKSRSVGANGWLQKPFDKERLMVAVNKYLG